MFESEEYQYYFLSGDIFYFVALKASLEQIKISMVNDKHILWNICNSEFILYNSPAPVLSDSKTDKLLLGPGKTGGPKCQHG